MKKSLAALLLVPFLMLGKPAAAQETAKKQPIEITVTYEAGNQKNAIIYGQSSYFYSQGALYNMGKNPLFNLTDSEKKGIAGIISGIEFNSIDSYKSLVESSKNLSGNQKLALLASISDLLYNGTYDHDLPNHEVYSQDVFFRDLQNFLDTEEDQNLGVCRHIATHIERLARDLGLTAASVTGYNGAGHAYDIIKTEDGKTAIVDGGNIIEADTKNIEKILESYQRNNNSIIFDHYFFEDSKLKYHLLTENGKNFLDFIGYDETINSLKDTLFSRDIHNPLINLIFNKTDSEVSGEAGFSGIFAKLGKFYGNSFLPLEELLFQTGYKNKFLISSLYLNPEISFVYGIPSNAYSDNKPILGATASLTASINNKNGINLAARLSGNDFMIDKLNGNLLNLFKSTNWSQIILYDAQFQLGTSYKIPIKNFTMQPYIISKFNLFPVDIGTYSYSPVLSEINGGIALSADIKNISVLLDPHYAWRPWEQEFGANAEIKTKNIGLNFGGYLTKSDYAFCPDKYGIEAGISANLDNLGIKLSYKNEAQNYDGETTNNPSFSVQGKLRF